MESSQKSFPIINNYYKTKLCEKFNGDDGICLRGKNCWYAHDINDLRLDNLDPLKFQAKFKTKICRNVSNCKNGNNCSYAHNEAECVLNSFKTKLCAYTYCSAGNNCRYAHGIAELRPRIQGEVDFYKTKLCEMFKINNYCDKGSKCKYAHGLHELRKISRT